MHTVEKRNHDFKQIAKFVNFEVENTIASVADEAASQRIPDQIQHMWIALRHVETHAYSPVQISVGNLLEADVEAAFTIDKACEVISHFGRYFSLACA